MQVHPFHQHHHEVAHDEVVTDADDRLANPRLEIFVFDFCCFSYCCTYVVGFSEFGRPVFVMNFVGEGCSLHEQEVFDEEHHTFQKE